MGCTLSPNVSLLVLLMCLLVDREGPWASNPDASPTLHPVKQVQGGFLAQPDKQAPESKISSQSLAQVWPWLSLVDQNLCSVWFCFCFCVLRD